MFSGSQSPTGCPISLEYSLNVHAIVAPKCIFTLAQSLHLSAFLSLHNNNIHGGIQTFSFRVSERIFTPAPLWPVSSLLTSQVNGLQLDLHAHLITASKCIFEPA